MYSGSVFLLRARGGAITEKKIDDLEVTGASAAFPIFSIQAVRSISLSFLIFPIPHIFHTGCQRTAMHKVTHQRKSGRLVSVDVSISLVFDRSHLS